MKKYILKDIYHGDPLYIKIIISRGIPKIILTKHKFMAYRFRRKKDAICFKYLIECYLLDYHFETEVEL